MAFAHTTKIANKYKHWPKEAYEANRAKLPTLCIFSYINNIQGVKLENIPSTQTSNQIAIIPRASTKEVDDKRADEKLTISKIQNPKDYAK